MVLLNQRIYYEKSADRVGTEELGGIHSSAIRSADSTANSMASTKHAHPYMSSDSSGELSTMQFAEGASQTDLKPRRKPSDDSCLELGPDS